jgi:LPXTG-motif cell wall-anchored protein
MGSNSNGIGGGSLPAVAGIGGGSIVATTLPQTGSNTLVALALAVAAGLVVWAVSYLALERASK